MNEDRPRKIALIGATGYEYASPKARVECFSWDRLKKATNLADYDVVVIDLLSLRDKESLDGRVLRELLDVKTTQEVLRKTGGAIYVLGDPRFWVKRGATEGEQSVPFLYWTGAEFAWDERPGDTVERRWQADRGPFKSFADALSRWSYSLAAARPELEAFAEVWNIEYFRGKGRQPAVLIHPICENSYGNHLVFSVSHATEEVAYQYGVQVPRDKQSLSGPIYFLPESELPEEEVLEFVLRDLCGVDVSAPEPEWIREISVPDQEQVERELDEIQRRVNELLEKRAGRLEERAALRRPLELLYQGGKALEEAVWSVLEQLGAEVERPEERNKEDGWITVQAGDDLFEGVLEVKSTDRQHFGTGGLRQLFDWINRGIARRKKRYTGIFVGNSSIKEPPKVRPWPFNKNWVEDAELYGFAAIRSEDLYVLYLLDRTNRLDRDEFWRSLFSTKGPFDMRPYRKQLTDDEKDQLEYVPAA